MSIIRIGDVLVSSEIITEYFCCDYHKCKGCCCIIGDSGAPLTEEECSKIEDEYPHYAPLLTLEEKREIDRTGFFSVDVDGDLVTPLLNGNQECVYTCFDENENCFCAIERSFFAGKSKFRKPASCWLYPIRVSKLSSGLTALNLHRWNLCKDAFEKGKEDNLRVYQFLKEPITECFGQEFYNALAGADKILTASS